MHTQSCSCFIRRPCSGDPFGTDQVLEFIPAVQILGLILFIQSKGWLSLASVMVQMLLFAAAVTPRTKRSLQIKHPEKPQQPTSIGSTEPTCPCLCTAPLTPDILQVSSHRVPPCGLLMTQSVPK